MKVGDRVLCIKQNGEEWVSRKYGKIKEGPIFKQELIITSINKENYLGFTEFPGEYYDPTIFIFLKEKEDKLTIKLESKKIIKEINIIQN